MARRIERPAHEQGPRILLLPFTHWRDLGGWRMLALVGAITLIIGSVAGIPDFGWLEATQLLIGVSCLRMIARAVESHPFASPFADGTLLAIGGLWAAVVTLVNAFDDANITTSVIIVFGCAALFLGGMMLRWDEGWRWYDDEELV